METKRHTDVGVERLRAPIKGRLEQRDSVVPGLRLRITHTGSKSWSVVYKVDGEEVDPKRRARPEHRMTLGKFPALDVDKARDAARDALTKAAKGVDPAKPDAAETAVTTVKALVEDYIERDAKPNLKKWKEVEGKLNKHLVSKLGTKALTAITRANAREWVEVVGSESGPGAAEEMLRRVKRVFNWAIEVEITELNPFDRVKLPSQYRPKARERTLTKKEIKAVWDAAKGMGYPFGPVYQLLMLTGQRREEISGMRRAWLSEDNVLEIPSESYKTKRVQVVPLPKAAQDIIKALPEVDEEEETGDFMFSTRNGTLPINGFSKAKARLDKLSGVSNWVVHDMRRTVRTNMPRLGIDKGVARKVIGHTDGGVDAVYDRYDYFDEKKAALETWAEYVMKVVK